MKYYINYVENSNPKIKVFKTKAALERFADKFASKVDIDNGYWIEFMFQGEMIYLDKYYKGNRNK